MVQNSYKAISFGNLFFDILVAIAILAFAFFSFNGLRMLIKEKAKFKKNVVEYVVTILFCCVSSFLIVYSSLSVATQIAEYVVPYKNGEYETVTGRIENYNEEDDHTEVSFKVDNINFKYYTTLIMNIGFNKSRSLYEGETVEIKYIVDPDEKSEAYPGVENIIMEITIINE